MYLKKLVLVATVICLAFAFSLSAYALPEEDNNNFFDTFVIDQEELVTNVEKDQVGLYEVSSDGLSVLQVEDTDINDYKVFRLNKGFTKLSIVTFANSKVFSGKGEEKTTVGVMVFNIKEGKIISTSDPVVIGASGLYNASISLKTGENMVIFAVKKDDLLIYRLFKVTVKEELTKGILENIQLKFITPAQTTTDQKSTTFSPFTVYNLPGVVNTAK